MGNKKLSDGLIIFIILFVTFMFLNSEIHLAIKFSIGTFIALFLCHIYKK